MAKTITTKQKFNALTNAKHIFAFKEEQTKFKIIDIVEGENSTKAVVELENGEIEGLFTDSQTAREALREVKNVFGADQPMVQIKLRQTAKGASVYYVEVL